jgi:hypothetical protein
MTHNIDLRSKKKYNIVGTVSKSNSKIVGRGQIDTPPHIYMTAHFPGWYRHFNKNGGVNHFKNNLEVKSLFVLGNIILCEKEYA